MSPATRKAAPFLFVVHLFVIHSLQLTEGETTKRGTAKREFKGRISFLEQSSE